jgi:ubiquinone/menaquinone biosynthesis C-methylase UbiE
MLTAVKNEEIVDFWADRAVTFGDKPSANTPDRWIHQVETPAVTRILESLPGSLDILDVGCANGYTTHALSRAFPQHCFMGVDLCASMIAVAKDRVSADTPNLRFAEANMLDLSLHQGQFDVVLSIRALINLPDTAAQFQAIDQIAACLRPGGHYICIENFRHGQENLNKVRVDLGLKPIDIRWNNCFFDEPEFRQYCSQSFDLAEFTPISSTYYLATRGIYAKMCQMEGREPDYDHPIYEIACKLPATGDFGPIKLSHWVKKDA